MSFCSMLVSHNQYLSSSVRVWIPAEFRECSSIVCADAPRKRRANSAVYFRDRTDGATLNDVDLRLGLRRSI